MSACNREGPGTSGGVNEELLPQSPLNPPLDFKSPVLRRHSVRVVRRHKRSLKVPLRAVRLCILIFLFPGLLIAVPLYLRFQVYGEQLYPVGMSDMRLLDNRVSTTWCQRQLIRANTTFNAFLLPGQPVVDPEPLKVSMTRHLELEDDMKEYWAFYLLQGSSVTVSTCVRYTCWLYHNQITPAAHPSIERVPQKKKDAEKTRILPTYRFRPLLSHSISLTFSSGSFF